MSEQPGIAQSITDLILSYSFDEALERLADPKDGGALPPSTAGLLKSRALSGVEKWHASYELLREVRAMKDLGVAERLEAQVRTARVLRFASPLIDYALDLAHGAAQQATRAKLNELAVMAHIEAALLYGRKRCKNLAASELDAAEKLGAIPEQVWHARGELAIQFDDRPAAKTAFETSLTKGDTRLGHLGLARLYTVLGEFDSAASELTALGKRPKGDVAVRRAEWRLWAAKGDWAKVAKALGELLEAVPAGDQSRYLMLERASSFYRAGDMDAARDAWVKIAASGDGDWAAKKAARMVEKIAAPNAKRARLTAFPSVTQLRNHCGPASVELCMRFFGTSAEQVAVAREIKHPDGGTPVHKMRAYMEAAGFHARRVEADLDRLRAILDAGVPVIIEEDYSTTRHVAVAIGYDDRREVLEVQDPMTHEIRETPYEELEKLRAFSNHGALVSVPSSQPELIAKLDAAGAVECEYISLTDKAWEAHHQDRHEDAEKLVNQAIELHEPYELAWVLRFVRARDAWDKEPNDESKKPMVGALQNILRIWPDDEWPQQFLGRVYEAEDRYQDALEAFERARDRDPDDSNNWCSIGDCQNELGRKDDARKSFEEALRRDPGHTRSNENLAAASFDNGDTSLALLLNNCALEQSPDNAFNSYTRGRILAKMGDLTASTTAFTRALELRPGASGYVVERARVMCRAGHVDDAMKTLETLREEKPKDGYVLVNYADLAYEFDRLEDCIRVCHQMRENDPSSPSPDAIEGAALCKKGELEAGVKLLRSAMTKRPTYAWAHREMAKGYAAAGKFDDAIASSAAALGLSHNAGNEHRLGDYLAKAGFFADAARYMRTAAGSGALSGAELDRTAEVIMKAEGANAAHRFFGSLTEDNPRDVEMARAHARFLLGTIWAPGPAVRVLSHLSELDHLSPLVAANEADDLMDASLEQEPEGEALFKQAIEQDPKLVAPRRYFARQLFQRGRYAESLAVLEPLPVDDETMADRVKALVGLRRDDEAKTMIDGWAATLPEDVRGSRRRQLDFEIAKANRRWTEALDLAVQIGKDEGELEDDGQLSRWETERFDCLVELGKGEEAYTFGVSQCADAEDRGKLAYHALSAEDWDLAKKLGTESFEEDEDEEYALAVMARVAEREGDVEGAKTHLERLREISTWHYHVENLGRIAMAEGDLDTAGPLFEESVASGHCCPVSLQLRAEYRLLKGDRAGAKADAERALGCLQLELRDISEDLDAILAGLDGKTGEVKALYEKLFARAKLTDTDKKRHDRIRAALIG